MIRIVDGIVPGVDRLRLWTQPDGPGPLDPTGLGIEWVGRAGHPTSYALLGGHLGPDGNRDIAVAASGRYAASLLRQADRVEFGLPHEYVALTGEGLGAGIVITVAAHEAASSSPMAFLFVARFLAAGLREGLPRSDSSVRKRWRSLTPELRSHQLP